MINKTDDIVRLATMTSKQANNRSGALEQGELSKPEIFQLLQKQKELGLPVGVRIANRSPIPGIHSGLGDSGFTTWREGVLDSPESLLG